MLAPPAFSAAVVLLEPVVEVAEAGRVDAVAKKPAEAEPPEQLAAEAAASQAAAPRLRGGRA